MLFPVQCDRDIQHFAQDELKQYYLIVRRLPVMAVDSNLLLWNIRSPIEFPLDCLLYRFIIRVADTFFVPVLELLVETPGRVGIGIGNGTCSCSNFQAADPVHEQTDKT